MEVCYIPLLSIDFESFDSLLNKSLTSQKSNYPKYDQIDNNCYAFVCRFLNEIKYLGRSSWTKEDLALNLIEEMIIIVDKYSSICKKLLMDDHYIVEKKSDEMKVSYSVCDICNEMVQIGDRFRCEECKDFDLCSLCYSQYGHNHKMVKI